CVWVTVRDKLACYRTLQSARHFRIPRSFAVESAENARQVIADHAVLFAEGFVLKPRVGWGGYGVQIGNPGDEPREIDENYLLSERIVPPRRDHRCWPVR